MRQSSDAMAIDHQINQESQAGGEEDGQQHEGQFSSPSFPFRKIGRAERITELERKLRRNEARIRELEQTLESERAKTAKFETRLARIEVVFNPRLLRTNEATLASLEQRNVMANGAAFNPTT
jgi:predicted RNase H-like nuclease (RuvC/YqgF family)